MSAWVASWWTALQGDGRRKIGMRLHILSVMKARRTEPSHISEARRDALVT